MPYVVTKECEDCGACIAGCETKSITEKDELVHIDVSLCIECGTCEMNCPVGAIVFIDDAEYEKIKSSPDAPPPASAEEQPR
jgi:ferredoxin